MRITDTLLFEIIPIRSIMICPNSFCVSFTFLPFDVFGHFQPCLDSWSTKYPLFVLLQCVLVLFSSFSVSCVGFFKCFFIIRGPSSFSFGFMWCFRFLIILNHHPHYLWSGVGMPRLSDLPREMVRFWLLVSLVLVGLGLLLGFLVDFYVL